MPYVNAAESTPGNETAEGLVISYDEGTKGTPAVKDDEGNITTEAVKGSGGTCRCGCGAEVPAGSLYRPGHDARLKGKLQRALLAGVTVTVNGAEMTPHDAAALPGFAPKGSVESLANAEARAAERAKGAEQREAEKAERKQARDEERAAAKLEREQAKANAKAEREAAEAAKAEADADGDETPKRRGKAA